MQRTERGKRGKRNLHLVAHSAHVEQNCVRTLVDELAAKRANHVERLSVRGTGVSIQRKFESYAVSQSETLTICVHAYENSDAVAFLLREENPDWPIEKID